MNLIPDWSQRDDEIIPLSQETIARMDRIGLFLLGNAQDQFLVQKTSRRLQQGNFISQADVQ